MRTTARSVRGVLLPRESTRAVALVNHLVAPDDPGYDLARRAWNLATDQRPALVAFPAELFNKSYEENQVEIGAVAARLGWPTGAFGRAAGLVVFTFLGALLMLALAGTEGAAGNPVAQCVALLVALPLVTFAYALPAELLARRRSGVRGLLRVLPGALLVAVSCTALSRLLRLEPPYLYGLFAGFVAVRSRVLAARHQGRAVLAGTATLFLVGTLAWLAWRPVYPIAHGPGRDWPAVLLDAALFWVVVLAAETLVFALAPVRFLDGALLRRWRLAAWLLPQAGAALAFAYVLVLRGTLSPPGGGGAAVLRALLFFLAFGAASVAFWGYFQWPGRPSRRLPTSSVSLNG